MNYYIADMHFGHANVLRFDNRPWETVEDMENALVERWNARVQKGDTVYILGDFCWQKELEWIRILNRLNGGKVLIVGNHDSSWMDRVDLSRYFVSVDPYLEITDGSRLLTLCHYPLLTWKHKLRQNSFMIHGHIHNDTTSDFFPLLAIRERALNAGVDINGFRPVTFGELAENNRAFKAAFLENSSEGI